VTISGKRRCMEWIMIPAAMAVMVLVGAGCRGAQAPPEELAQVTGRITLDGQPLVEGDITFEPEKGAASLGSTDSNGNYKLIYNAHFDGAVVGHHIVRISKIGKPGTEFDTVNMISAKFNEKSTLDATVNPGENTINFELKSK